MCIAPASHYYEGTIWDLLLSISYQSHMNPIPIPHAHWDHCGICPTSFPCRSDPNPTSIPPTILGSMWGSDLQSQDWTKWTWDSHIDPTCIPTLIPLTIPNWSHVDPGSTALGGAIWDRCRTKGIDVRAMWENFVLPVYCCSCLFALIKLYFFDKQTRRILVCLLRWSCSIYVILSV